MNNPVKAERAWFEQMLTSKLIGICIIDAEGRPVQQYIDDPELRTLILDYQAEKLRQLSKESSMADQDVIYVQDSKQWLDLKEVTESVKTRPSTSPTLDNPPPEA